MMAIADNRHFSYDNENGLAEVVASEMQKEDPSNEENLLGSSIHVTHDRLEHIIKRWCTTECKKHAMSEMGEQK